MIFNAVFSVSLSATITYGPASLEDVMEITYMFFGMHPEDAKNLVILPDVHFQERVTEQIERNEIFVARNEHSIIAILRYTPIFNEEHRFRMYQELGCIRQVNANYYPLVALESSTKCYPALVKVGQHGFFEQMNLDEQQPRLTHVTDDLPLDLANTPADHVFAPGSIFNPQSALLIYHGMVYVRSAYRGKGVYTFLLLAAFHFWRAQINDYLLRNRHRVTQIVFSFCQLQRHTSRSLMFAFLATMGFIKHDLISGSPRSHRPSFVSTDSPKTDTPYLFSAWDENMFVYKARFKTIKPGINDDGKAYYNQDADTPHQDHQVPQVGFGKLFCASLLPNNTHESVHTDDLVQDQHTSPKGSSGSGLSVSMHNIHMPGPCTIPEGPIARNFIHQPTVVVPSQVTHDPLLELLHEKDKGKPQSFQHSGAKSAFKEGLFG